MLKTAASPQQGAQQGAHTGTLPWAALAAAGVHVAYVAASMPRLLRAAFWDSDSAAIPVIVRHLPSLRGGAAVLGDNSNYSTLLFDFATRTLAGHRRIWELMPAGVAVLTGVVLVWIAWRAAGRWAAALAGAIAAGVSPAALETMLKQSYRSQTWLTVAVLGALPLLLSAARRSRSVLLLGLGAGALAAPALASDPLLAPAGLLPLLGASLGFRILRPGAAARRVLTGSYLAGAVAVAGGGAIWLAMRSIGFTSHALNGGIGIGIDGLAGRVGVLAGALVALANGPVAGHGPPAALTVASVAALLAGGAFIPLLLALRAAGPPGTGPERGDRRLITILYWTLVPALTLLAFMLTDAASEAAASARYLVPLLLAGAVLVPVWAAGGRMRRLGAVAGATVFIVASTSSLGAIWAPAENQPLFARSGEVASFLRSQDAEIGYAGYWQSHGLTWASDFAVRAYPVWQCRLPASSAPCPFFLNQMPAWYRPRPSTRTFLIAGGSRPFSLPARPPPELGPPDASASFDGMLILVYPYDIAQRFLGPAAK